MFSRIGLIILLPLFWGCATTPQLNVSPSDAFWQNSDQKIGVYVSEVPPVKGHIVGANCLLCLAAASAINADLDKHMKKQTNEDLASIKDELIKKLEAKGMNVVAIDEPIAVSKLKKYTSKTPNSAKRDFRALGEKLGVDYILMVQLNLVGTLRTFANYVPVGEPAAVFKARMYIVNSSNNVYELYEDIDIAKLSETKWKEPPNYPGITNAYYTAIELGKSQVLDLEVGGVVSKPQDAAESNEDAKPAS